MGRNRAEQLKLWDLMIEKMKDREVFYVTDIARDCDITADTARCNIDVLKAKRIIYLEKDKSRKKHLITVDEKMHQYYASRMSKQEEL